MIERQERVLELLIAHQQLPESVEPTVAGLHHPAPRFFVGVAFFLRRFAFTADHMGDVAVRQDDCHCFFAAIARIGAQVLGAALLGRWALDHNGLEHRLNLSHVVCVGSRHDD